MNRLLVAGILVLIALWEMGCYKFTGIAIDPTVITYYVDQFENRSPNAPPTLAPDFSEKLKDKFRNESRLIYSEEDPHVEFSGSITSFRVTSEAPQANEQVALNRLTISVSVEYVNHKDEEQNRSFTKSWYGEFPSEQNLLEVQDALIETITNQLVEDIFTEAFTSW